MMKRAFHRDERGATLIEFALFTPVLLFVLLGSMTAFDLFRNSQNVEKATFTIGDMLSRQTVVTASTLTGMLDLMRHTVGTASDGGLRVSSIGRQNGAFVVRWSRTAGSNVPTTPIPSSILPEIANGDTVLLTESFVPHEAVFAGFGIENLVFSSAAAHRPRFINAIPYQ
jgi:Flp pilus assembly protein TadG